MISVFYLICLVLATGCLLYMTKKKSRYVDKYYWSMLFLIPIIILGYWIKSTIHSPEAGMVAMCFIYLDSTVLLVLLFFSILTSMKIEVNRWIKFGVYTVTVLHLLSIWLSKDTGLYYSAVEIEESSYGTLTTFHPGPLKITHYIYLAGVFVALCTAIIYGLKKKGTFSRRTMTLYSIFAFFGIAVYGVELLSGVEYSFLPGVYVLGSFIMVITYDNIQSHDMFMLIGEKELQTGKRGFCAIDTNRCILGYNNQFLEMVPDMKNIVIDDNIPKEYTAISSYLNRAVGVFDERGEFSDKIVLGDKIFELNISSFSIGEKKINGYLLEMSDITDEQMKIDIVEQYNERLSKEVSQKTEHIVEIQNSVVLGLADLVENRDDNTGGHVKRTSDIVRILLDEILRQGNYDLSTVDAKAIIRAAAMHDLGKISIDSAILCKPARLTPEEFDIMKTHAPKSGEIVRIILQGVEEQHFVDIAYNLARYHHERWDGKGYPEGLLGESIPTEARIMAVADVYDALVSERCYKEAMSFEEAAYIMNDCMGSQFDPSMRPIFAACREKLENYYRTNA